MKGLILLFIISLSVITAFPQNKSKKLFVLKLIDKPAVLRIGQKHKFVFDVINTSETPLTLSSLCSAGAGLSWENGDGTTGGGIGIGCVSASGVVDDDYESKTKLITGTARIVPYTRSSFFTLDPNGTKRFEVELKVPEDMKPRWIKVYLRFESKYDGNLIGINAWTGEASYISLKMFVRK
jgi:hypothetical protein